MARFTTRGPKGDTGASGNGSPTDTYSKIILTNNGTVDNIKIGDDVYLGDGNVANSVVIKGQQNATVAGIVLGIGKTETISTDGTNLSLDADNDIILYPGSTYAYIGTPTIGGETRIATIGDLKPTPIAYTPVWSGTGLTQSSNLATGTYFDYGQMVVVQITVPMTNVTHFGTGAYSVTLPKQSALHANAWGGTIHHTDLNRYYSIKGHLEPNSNVCSLWFLNQSSQDQEFKATSPFILTTTDMFHINFIYQANQ